MKVPLSSQIEEAELHLAQATKAAAANPSLQPRLDASEGIVLTLRLIEAVEPDFRLFMDRRGKETR